MASIRIVPVQFSKERNRPVLIFFFSVCYLFFCSSSNLLYAECNLFLSFCSCFISEKMSADHPLLLGG